MRTALTMIAAAALLAAACAAPADDTGDDTGRDRAALDTTTPPAAAPAPGTVPDPAGADRPAPDRPDAPAEEPAAEPPADPERGDVAASIPARFHGEWNADLDACGTGASETRLRISADRVRFYESAGAVRRVEIVNSRVIDVTAEYQGEGDTWEGERRFTLSDDGNSLTVSNGGDLVRYRCP